MDVVNLNLPLGVIIMAVIRVSKELSDRLKSVSAYYGVDPNDTANDALEEYIIKLERIEAELADFKLRLDLTEMDENEVAGE